MILSQILYQKGNDRKNVVILILGRKGDKLSAIIDDAIDKREAEIIINNSKKLDGYQLHNKINWLKRNVPEAYRKGYREFFLNKITMQRSFSLTSKKFVKTNPRAT